MKNTTEIQNAIRHVIADMGSQAALARHIGVANSTVGDWLSGNASTIREAHWQKLITHVKPYLPKQNTYPEVAETAEKYGDVDPLCSAILQNWDSIDPAAQNEILRIVEKYRK